MKITKKQKPSLSIRERGLRDYMREHCNDDGLFTQPQQMIANELECSQPNICKLQKSLILKRCISIKDLADCKNHVPAVYKMDPIPQGIPYPLSLPTHSPTITPSTNDIYSTVLSIPWDRGEGIPQGIGGREYKPCAVEGCVESVDPYIPDEVEAGKCYQHLYAEVMA